MGVAATFVSASLVKRLGILKVFFLFNWLHYWFYSSFRFLCYRPPSYGFSQQAGAVGLIFQASLLTVAVAVYWSGYLSRQTPLLFFLCLIVSTICNFLIPPTLLISILESNLVTYLINFILLPSGKTYRALRCFHGFSFTMYLTCWVIIHTFNNEDFYASKSFFFIFYFFNYYIDYPGVYK